MLRMRMKIAGAALCFFLFTLPAYTAQTERSSAAAAFLQGADAFRAGDYIDAVVLLKKAVSYPDNYNADTFYMLITAQMYMGDYKNAFHDCEIFMHDFPDSPYISYVTYHNARALYCLGEYEKSVLLMSGFCHQYPEHEMYASALNWIAESFYAGANYDDAELLYSRIVHDFPDDAKAPAAQFRIESIAQMGREEKLIYLLKQTGEEYLAAKEEYERQLKLATSESAAQTRRRVLELQRNNAELEKRVSELEAENARLAAEADERAKAQAEKDSIVELLRDLKRKASETQKMIDGKEPKKK